MKSGVDAMPLFLLDHLLNRWSLSAFNKVARKPETFLISPSTQGHHVQFSFSRFQFEDLGKVCRENYDWLKFIDGVAISDKTIDFCSNGPEPLNKTFSSENNEITLWMFSDKGDGGKGDKTSNTIVHLYANLTNTTRLFKRFPFLI